MIKTLALQIAKRLLLFALDEGLKRALPRIYRQLDHEMPQLMRNEVSPKIAQSRIEDITHFEIKAMPTPTQIDLVKLLYDPVLAVGHHYLGKRR